MKQYENYINKLKDNFNRKIKIIEKFINFINKYGLSYLMIFHTEKNITIEILHKYTDDIYKLEYTDETPNSGLVSFDTNLSDDVFNILEKIINTLNIQDVINITYDYNEIFSILKHTNEKLNLKEVFHNTEFVDLNIKILNDINFQDIILKKQSANYIYFFELFDLYNNIKLDQSIKNKYNNLYTKYLKIKKSKKYNI